jgi:sulfide:quinone oxidoreductase
MSGAAPSSEKFQVVIGGGGVGALEATIALRDLAGDRVAITLLSDRDEFVYRPMTVREPFAYPAANRYPLAPIAADFEAELVRDRLEWVESERKTVHTEGGQAFAYDALLIATGSGLYRRYEHALTIDDRNLDETLHGLIQDVEGGYAKRLAFVIAPRMAWPLPIYELALMTVHRAYGMSMKCEVTLVTPEDAPLAIFGSEVSQAVAALLEASGIRVLSSSYAEVPESRQVLVRPGDETLDVDRVVALPELVGPGVRGLPLGEHGFLEVDPHGRVRGVERVFAAGDVTDFPVKFGGIAAQQADAAAQSIAALAGAPIDPQPMHPTIHGMLLTGERPRYLSAQITGGAGFASEFSESPSWTPVAKIAARYLAPYLDQLDGVRSSE